MNELRAGANGPLYVHIAESWTQAWADGMREMVPAVRKATTAMMALHATMSEAHAAEVMAWPWHRRYWHFLTGHRR